MNTLRRHIEYCRGILYQELRRDIEYKAQLYSHLITMFFVVTTVIFLVLTLNSHFSEHMPFSSQKEILFFIFSAFFSHSLLGAIGWSKQLSRDLLRGDLNLILIRPVSPILFHFFFRTRTRRLVSAFIFLCFLIWTAFPLRVEFLLSLLLILLGSLFYLFFYVSIDSLSFFIKQTNQYKDTLNLIVRQAENFPMIFTNTKLSVFLASLPIYYYSYLNVQIYFGKVTFFDVIPNIIILILLIIGFLLIYIILWYYGLKKYEAYG
jgi:ABC-2 type transport system permease protein